MARHEFTREQMGKVAAAFRADDHLSINITHSISHPGVRALREGSLTLWAYEWVAKHDGISSRTLAMDTAANWRSTLGHRVNGVKDLEYAINTRLIGQGFVTQESGPPVMKPEAAPEQPPVLASETVLLAIFPGEYRDLDSVKEVLEGDGWRVYVVRRS